MQSLERQSSGELHYSGVVTISRNDVFRVREVLVKAFEDVRFIVKASKDEEVYCYNLDLFGLARNDR